MLGGVATSVIMPEMRAAMESGHHQVAWRQPHGAGDAQDDGNEDGDDAGRAHESAKTRHRQHQEDYKPDFAAAGRSGDQGSKRTGYARAHQGVTDHEQRGDQDDALIGKAGRAPPVR